MDSNMICEEEFAKQTGSRYDGTCQCERCKKEQKRELRLETLERRETKRRQQKTKAKKTKDMTKEQVTKALHNVLNKPYDANSVMVLLMAFHHSIPSWDSWEWVEEIITEVVGDKPEWHECKKLLRKLTGRKAT